MGWVVQQTPNGTIVWHNGGTSAFGSYFGIVPEKNVGVVVLTNEVNVGLPDAIGRWVMDRILDNPNVDHRRGGDQGGAGRIREIGQAVRQAGQSAAIPAAGAAGRDFHQSGLSARRRCALEGDALVMSLEATGAKLRLAQWDGSIFTARLMPLGQFAAVAEDLGPLPTAFVQFQMDKDARLNVLRLSFDDGQAYEFTRE